MPYCPSCHSEYRAGIEACGTCDDRPALVAELPESVEITDDDETKPVAITDDPEAARTVELDGRTIDLMRAFALGEAREIAASLVSQNVVSRIKPIEGVVFPGGQQRFEVHVRAADHESAERQLIEAWRDLIDTGEEDGGVDFGSCPACGAEVPTNVEECPDCGLFVGMGEDDEPEAAPEEPGAAAEESEAAAEE